MIKYESDGVRIWVDQDSGTLNVQTDNSFHEINFHDAGRIIGLIRQDRAIFEERIKEENSTWNKLMRRLK